MLNTKEIYIGKTNFYVTGRPSYPAEISDFLRSTLGINPSSTIADIGAGTGIFTRCLLNSGAYVYAIEPNQDMLEKASYDLKEYPKFTPVNASAEETTLLSESVDLISVAQALHWFSTKETKKEFERILRPRGGYLFLWNERLKDCDSFHRGLETILRSTLESYNAQTFQDTTPQALVSSFLGTDNWTTRALANKQKLSKEGLLGRVFSSSYSPKVDTELGQLLKYRLEDLFETLQVKERINIKYETIIIHARDTRC